MSEKFFTSSLTSKYIKYLLAYTPLPLYPLIEHKQYMVKGCTYIHKTKLLKCTESGIFNGLSEYDYEHDYLYCNEDLTVQDSNIKDYMQIMDYTGKEFDSPLVVIDYLMYIKKVQFAKYSLIGDYVFGEDLKGITNTFISNTSFYDSDTHKQLGEYLRLLKNYYNMDLMSLYNCYNYTIVDNVQLSETYPYVTDIGNSKNKVMLVPIKFNTTYTIAMDSLAPVLMKAVVYKNNGLVIDDSRTEFIANKLIDRTVKFSNTQFRRPVTFRVDNRLRYQYSSTDSDEKVKYLQQFEKDLYIAIQVPASLNSTLTVLEGNFSNTDEQRICDISIIHKGDTNKLNNALVAVPSLLNINDGQQHPFSDKLISYLLRNTIDEREYIDDNVANIEKKIDYNPLYQGMWDSKLRYILYNKYMNLGNMEGLSREDILGFVDRDIEDAVRKGYINYVT